jgi:hypothetical protein
MLSCVVIGSGNIGLGADPTTLDHTELAAVPVAGTWLAGVQVFGG